MCGGCGLSTSQDVYFSDDRMDSHIAPGTPRLMAAKYDMDANPRRAYARYTPERSHANATGDLWLYGAITQCGGAD